MTVRRARGRSRRVAALGLVAGLLSACGNELPLKIGVVGFQVDDEGTLELRMILCRGELDSVTLSDLDSDAETPDWSETGLWEPVGEIGPGVHVLQIVEPGPDWRTLREPDLDVGPSIDRRVHAIGPLGDEVGSLDSRLTDGATLADLRPGEVTDLHGGTQTQAAFDSQCSRPRQGGRFD